MIRVYAVRVADSRSVPRVSGDDSTITLSDARIFPYFPREWMISEEAFVTWLYCEFILVWEASEASGILAQKVESIKVDIAQDFQKIQTIKE